MSWFNLWDGLKTKTCRYLLQRYLGQFFENNLNLEQLKIDLYNGEAVVENISLKVKALNDLFEDQGWAFEVISGHIGCLTAMVPWNALMTNDSSLNVSNLTITLRPVTRCQNGTTMLESMWSSVSSSMQMAEECMKQIDDDIPFLNHNNTLIGLEKFAETIDNVLNRIHANLTNTTINIEYVLPKSSKKLIISIKANHIEYKNQTGYEKYFSSDGELIENGITDKSLNMKALPMIAKHNLVTSDLTIHTSEISNTETNIAELLSLGRLCKIVEFKGCQNFKISVKQTEKIIGPKINLEVTIDDIYFMLTPRQTHMLIRIFKGFDKVRPNDKLMQNYSELKPEIHKTHFSKKMSGIVEQDKEWCAEDEGYKKLDYFTDNKKSKKCESLISSTSTNSITTSYSNAQINEGSDEKSGEILKFKLQIYKIVGVILHSDILFENAYSNIGSSCIYTTQSFTNYFETASHFFQTAFIERADEKCYIPIQNKNYLLLMVSSLLVSGDQKRLCNELILKTTLSATMCDICEILDNKINHLIMFDRKKNCQDGYHTRPEIILSHISSCLFKQNHNITSNKIELTLDDCSAELDISIYDRLSSLLAASPFIQEENEDENISKPVITMDMNIRCKSIKCYLRFPVNGGLSKNRDRVESLKKNIRKDYLLFNLLNILIEWKSYFCIFVDQIDGYYCNDTFETEIKILQCSYYSKLDCLTEVDKICFKIHINNDAPISSIENCPIQKRRSPFSSKCSYGYSTHIEGFHDNSDKSDFFLPGDTDEIVDFCESCKQLSNIKILASIPVIKIVIESKEIYEIIYNRLNSDLLMWEPHSSIINHEKPVSSFELSVKQGAIVVYTNAQEVEAIRHVSQRGKLQVKFKDFRLFSAAALNNEKNISYFCIQIKEIDVHHSGQVFQEVNAAWTDEIDNNLTRIICNISEEKRVTNNRHEIISVVAEIKKKPEKRLKRMKLAFGLNGASLWHKPAPSVNHWLYQLIDFLNITDYPIESYEPYALVSEIQGHIWNLAIEYRPKYLPYRALLDIGYCSFSSNIIYPMTGCTLRLISEDCILSIGQKDKAVNDVQEFITRINKSGLVPVLNVGLLNFSIHLNEHNKSYPSIDLRSSIHDIHLKTCYDGAEVLAQLISYIANDKDFKTSMNNANSFNKTDITPVRNADHTNDKTVNQINTLMADAVKDVKTLSVPQPFDEILKVENESLQSKPILSNNRFDFDQIFDMRSQDFYKYDTTENSFINTDLGAISLNVAPTLEEKEFHIIHDEDILFMDNFGVDQIYVSDGPLQIVDNHFSLPSEKNDILSPPPNFPIPEHSYTLCEMTFTWHLYGGKDFPDITKSNPKDNTSFTAGMSETYEYGVSQAPSKHQANTKNMVYNDMNTCRNLDVLVEIQFTKIRFSYDAYPKHSIYSSRQVLVISDIEIRDRLLSSDINKLLYHPHKSNASQKNDENMIMIKALNARSNLKKHRGEECSLKVSILPIRLNIDQDTLLFLEEFFSALVKSSENSTSLNNLKRNTVAIYETSNSIPDLKRNDETDTDIMNAIIDPETSIEDEDNPIYFKEFIFSPALPICFDYHGRRVELSHGPITGLIMGLAQLQGSGICLREVINRSRFFRLVQTTFTAI
ncbi:autophagy-related protein 2 homolog A isoform X5 [Drosophila mojavensis]|nr:autophagy-related protein 2 homolog A isoform X5 [Drosophila mojavensis]